jgi:hypothetical protein
MCTGAFDCGAVPADVGDSFVPPAYAPGMTKITAITRKAVKITRFTFIRRSFLIVVLKEVRFALGVITLE